MGAEVGSEIVSGARVGVGSRVAGGGRGEIGTITVDEFEGVSVSCEIGRNGL